MTNSKRIATALTADGQTRISIWREIAYTGRTGRTVYIVEFVHMLKRAADRRSITWATKTTEAAASASANECFAQWNGTRKMVVEA